MWSIQKPIPLISLQKKIGLRKATLFHTRLFIHDIWYFRLSRQVHSEVNAAPIIAHGKLPASHLPVYSFYYGTPTYDFRLPLNPVKRKKKKHRFVLIKIEILNFIEDRFLFLINLFLRCIHYYLFPLIQEINHRLVQNRSMKMAIVLKSWRQRSKKGEEMKKLKRRKQRMITFVIFNRNKFCTWWNEILRNSFYFLFSLLLKIWLTNLFYTFMPRTIWKYYILIDFINSMTFHNRLIIKKFSRNN